MKISYAKTGETNTDVMCDYCVCVFVNVFVCVHLELLIMKRLYSVIGHARGAAGGS